MDETMTDNEEQYNKCDGQALLEDASKDEDECVSQCHDECVKDNIDNATREINEQEEDSWKYSSYNPQTADSDCQPEKLIQATTTEWNSWQDNNNSIPETEMRCISIANNSNENSSKSTLEITDNTLDCERLNVTSELDKLNKSIFRIEESMHKINAVLLLFKDWITIHRKQSSENYDILQSILNRIEKLSNKQPFTATNEIRCNPWQNKINKKEFSENDHASLKGNRYENSMPYRKPFERPKSDTFPNKGYSNTYRTQDTSKRIIPQIKTKHTSQAQTKRLFVSRLLPETPDSEIERVLHKKHGYTVKAVKLENCNKYYASFCVSVSAEHYEELKNPKYWPREAVVMPYDKQRSEHET